MANVVPLYPQQIAAPQSPKKRCLPASRQSAPSATLPPYLSQRNGVFYFKRKIPASLVQAFGNQAQIWKSLETADFAVACRQLAKETAAFELRVATVRLRMVSEGLPIAPASNVIALREDMIAALLQRYQVHMLDREEGELRSMRPNSIADLKQRIGDVDETLQYYRLALTCGDHSVVEQTAKQILAGEALSARTGSEIYTHFCELLLSTEVKILSEQRARLDGNKQPTPQEPLPIRLQPTMTDYLNTWMNAKIRPQKTRDTASFMVRLWIKLMGDNPAATITRVHVKAFRDKLLARELSTETIKNRLGLLGAVVNTYNEENDIEGVSNPFKKIPVQDNGQHVRALKDRRAFETGELNKLYSSTLFTEHKLPRGQVGEAAYWMPLMGPFVGARIEELAQMRLVDIEIINGVWSLRICNLDPTTQKLKNSNSFRRVPIHDELISLGFLRYVCDLKRRGEERLFPTLRADNKYGIWSNAVGQSFGRMLTRLGMTSAQLDYHSFRYNFKQRLSLCGVDSEVRDALAGHWTAKDGAGNVYMKAANCQYDFMLLCDAIKSLRYDEVNLTHLHVEAPWHNVDTQLFLSLA